MKTITSKIGAGFGLVLTLIVVVACVGVFSLFRLGGGLQEMAAAEKLERLFADMRIAGRAYFSSGDVADSDQFYQDYEKFNETIKRNLQPGENRDALLALTARYRDQFEYIVSLDFRLDQAATSLTEKAQQLVADSRKIAERETRIFTQFDKVVAGATEQLMSAADQNDLQTVNKAGKRMNAARKKLSVNQQTAYSANEMALHAQTAELATLAYFVDPANLQQSEARISKASKDIFTIALKMKKTGSRTVKDSSMAIAKLAQSYRRDFKVASELQGQTQEQLQVAGVLEGEMVQLFGNVIDEVRSRSESAVSLSKSAMITGATISLVIGVIAALVIARNLSRPVRQLTDAVTALSQGQLEVSVPFQARQDELGQMAKAIKILKPYASDARRLEDEQKKAQIEDATRQQKLRENLATDFEGDIGQLVTSFEAATGDMSSSAEGVEAASSTAATVAATMKQNADRTNEGVNRIATAAAELNVTVELIRQEVTQAERSALEASGKTSEAEDQIKDLDSAVHVTRQCMVSRIP